jgi:hypothetical protein
MQLTSTHTWNQKFSVWHLPRPRLGVIAAWLALPIWIVAAALTDLSRNRSYD